MELKYGMTIKYPMKRISVIMGENGVKISNSPVYEVECTVEKHKETDTDPYSYKIKLVPVSEKDKFDFGTRNVYSLSVRQYLKIK